MFGPIGMTELLIIAAVCLLVFGPRQLPKLGRALGETIKEFRGVGKQLQEAQDDLEDTWTGEPNRRRSE